MCASAKHRLVAGSRLLMALGLWLPLFTHVAQAQSITSPIKIVKAVPASSDVSIRFIIKTGETEARFIVEAPVKGLLYFDVDTKTGLAIQTNFLSKNGGVLGVGGVRLAQPGRIRVQIARRNSSGADKDLRIEGKFVLLENDPDIFEPNDTLKATRVLKLGPDNPIAGGPAMIFPAGDTDWFRLDVTAPGLITPYFLKPVSAKVTIRVLDANGNQISLGKATRVESGMLTFKVVGSAIGFELIEIGFAYQPIWDDCKANMQRENACMLQSGQSVNITLRPHRAFSNGKKQSMEKWFSISAPETGYIMLSLSGMPKPKYNTRNVQIEGLKLQANALFTEGGNSKYITTYVSHGSVIFRAEKPGVYKIGLRGNWLNADPLRAMKLSLRFQRYIATSIQDADLAIMGMAPDDRGGKTALGLAMLAGVGGGYFADARTSKKIKSVMKEFIGGINRKPANAQPEAPTTSTGQRIARSEPESTPLPKPTLTTEQIELARLNELRTYLEADKDRFLYRHHFRTSSGGILKKLEKTELPGKMMAKHVLTKTEKLSPIISRRLLIRYIQNLE